MRAHPAALAALLAGLAGITGAESFRVDVSPVPLNVRDEGRSRVGQLEYRGGVRLRAFDTRFGGLSDLRVAPDGRRVLMISDCGYALRATLDYDARGFLIGIGDPQMAPLLAPGSRALRAGEEDAEALVEDGRGGYVVAFERTHRLWDYPTSDLSGSPLAKPLPARLVRAAGNLGIEAMTRLADGRLLLFGEGPSGSPAYSTAWVEKGSGWSEWRYPLVYDPPENREPFRPTSAVTMSNGDVLVLERRYPPVGVRIRRLDKASLRDGGDLLGRELARLESPLTVDNYEGIDVREVPGGETLVYLLSDDNGCRKLLRPAAPTSQRTLLLLFALVP